jgi:hypothetical protein
MAHTHSEGCLDPPDNADDQGCHHDDQHNWRKLEGCSSEVLHLIGGIPEGSIDCRQTVENLPDNQDANGECDRDLNHHVELADHLPRLDLAGLIRVKITGSAPEAVRLSYFVFDASERATVSD